VQEQRQAHPRPRHGPRRDRRFSPDGPRPQGTRSRSGTAPGGGATRAPSAPGTHPAPPRSGTVSGTPRSEATPWPPERTPGAACRARRWNGGSRAGAHRPVCPAPPPASPRTRRRAGRSSTRTRRVTTTTSRGPCSPSRTVSLVAASAGAAAHQAGTPRPGALGRRP
jgi:hypothetical protein